MSDGNEPKAFCPACGTPNLSRRTHCSRCGADLTAAAAPREVKSTMMLGTMNPYQDGPASKPVARRASLSSPPGRAKRVTRSSVPPPKRNSQLPFARTVRAEHIPEEEASERRTSVPPPLPAGGPLRMDSPLADEDSMLGSAELKSLDAPEPTMTLGQSTFLSRQRQQLAQVLGRSRDRLAYEASRLDTWPRRSLVQLGGVALLLSSLLTCLLTLTIVRGCGGARSVAGAPDLTLTVAAHTATSAALGAILQACAHDGTAERASHWFVPERRDALLRDACRLQKLAQGMASFEAVAALPLNGNDKGKLASGLGIDPEDCLELALESGSVSACFSGAPPRYQILDFEIDQGS